MPDKEKLFLKWFHDHREDMHINLSTVGGLRAAFFGGLEAVEQSVQSDAAFCACENPDVYINRICQICGKPHALRR